MTKRALIVVDYSNDFVAPNGALTCGEAGQAIEPLSSVALKSTTIVKTPSSL